MNIYFEEMINFHVSRLQCLFIINELIYHTQHYFAVNTPFSKHNGEKERAKFTTTKELPFKKFIVRHLIRHIYIALKYDVFLKCELFLKH